MKHWFPKEVVKHKRAKIAEIIRNLAAKQNPDKKLHFPQLEFIGMGSGYTDDEDDDDMDDMDYNKDLRPIHRIPPTTTLLPSTSATATPKTTSISNQSTLAAADNNDGEDMEDEYDGADSDDLESAIPQKEVRAPTLPSNKGKMAASVKIKCATRLEFGIFCPL